MLGTSLLFVGEHADEDIFLSVVMLSVFMLSDFLLSFLFSFFAGKENVLTFIWNKQCHLSSC